MIQFWQKEKKESIKKVKYVTILKYNQNESEWIGMNKNEPEWIRMICDDLFKL